MGISKINVNGIDVPITPDIEDRSIEKAKLAEAVQESLEKADSALQEVPNTYRTSEEQDEIDAGLSDAIDTETERARQVEGALNTGKQDKLSNQQLANIDAVPDKIDKENLTQVVEDIELNTDNGVALIVSIKDTDTGFGEAKIVTLPVATPDDIDDINAKIPSQASSDNKLADMDTLNSSIATETAHYISDHGEPFTSALLLPTEGVTNNDYAIVTGEDDKGNTYFDKYKATVVGSSVTWGKEYRLNNSSFTAAQWAAISSGITAALVGKLTDLPTYAALTALLAGKISNPTGGTAGQVLTKTEDGEEWADSQGGGGDTSEIEEAAAAALNELWWKTLSPARKTVLREDIIDDFKHPYSSHPISARIAKVLDEHLKEIELIAASALVNLNEMKAFMGAIAPEWDGQHAYSVGDLRTHGGKLWKCDTAYDEPEDTFDAAKWHTTTIVEEFITSE